jgi:hypothetical protein
VWTKKEQMMKTRRYFHTAFLIPDNIANCFWISISLFAKPILK